jgi:protein-S-isoprenylcysteine O-methyltransferase Ste14
LSVAGWAAALMVVYLLLAFGVRVAVQLRRTGSSGISSLRSAPPIELVGGGMFATAIVLFALNPLLVLNEMLARYDGLVHPGFQAAGFTLAGIGIAGTFLAQMAMGASWRIGVDPAERTELVTDGVFRLSRNPIYTFMIVAWLGFALLLPTWLALASGVLLIVGLEIQVRLVEEPHLVRTHGRPYLAWASRVGRFLPGVGRLDRA